MTGMIFDIKEMAVHDGPGIRTTVFFKGCPLRCQWCHNPEGLSSRPQLMFKKNRCLHCGRCQQLCQHPECRPFGRCIHACPEGLLSISGELVTEDDLHAAIRASAEVLAGNFGGVTFSGGEPLMQWEFLLAAARELSGFHLCMETSGYAEPEVFEQVLCVLDYVIFDIKLADPVQHLKYTGGENIHIISNFHLLQSSGKPYLVRTPLIPGITDIPENLSAIRTLIGSSQWECLPYNTMAPVKYEMLNMRFPLYETV